MPKKATPNGGLWRYTGELIQACNCDWGCPCNFSRRPTMGYCEGGYGVNIKDGVYGSIKLDGLKYAWLARWPGQIHEGRGTAGIYIDEKATKEQRDALVRILTGRAGGLPWTIFAATIDTWLEPKFVPFEWKFDGVHSSFKAGPFTHASLEPMRNPVTGDESAAKLVLPKGFVFKEAEIGSSRSFAVVDKGLRYAYPGKAASVAIVRHPTR